MPNTKYKCSTKVTCEQATGWGKSEKEHRLGRRKGGRAYGLPLNAANP